ncbi:hypothetical protein HY967_03155 [Candidatus Jorgensenbacteria bacterium]|nr:hypothetical protein [Candidatus Jorgensenbacteria bacterium]
MIIPGRDIASRKDRAERRMHELKVPEFIQENGTSQSVLRLRIEEIRRTKHHNSLDDTIQKVAADRRSRWNETNLKEERDAVYFERKAREEARLRKRLREAGIKSRR